MHHRHDADRRESAPRKRRRQQTTRQQTTQNGHALASPPPPRTAPGEVKTARGGGFCDVTTRSAQSAVVLTRARNENKMPPTQGRKSVLENVFGAVRKSRVCLVFRSQYHRRGFRCADRQGLGMFRSRFLTACDNNTYRTFLICLYQQEVWPCTLLRNE